MTDNTLALKYGLSAVYVLRTPEQVALDLLADQLGATPIDTDQKEPNR